MKNNLKDILKRSALAVLFLHWLFITPTFSLMIKLPLERLTQAANVIILGDVEDIRCEWSLNKEIILTVTTLKIKEIWKGNIQHPKVLIQSPGGTIGDLSLNVSDTSVFQKGEEVLVFLKAINNVKHLENSFTISLNFLPSFFVFGRAQGKYSIDENKIARKGGYSLLDKEVNKDCVLALSELEARIKVFVKNDMEKRQEKHEKIWR